MKTATLAHYQYSLPISTSIFNDPGLSRSQWPGGDPHQSNLTYGRCLKCSCTKTPLSSGKAQVDGAILPVGILSHVGVVGPSAWINRE